MLKNNIIIVPDSLSKTRVVNASGNVLVDASNTNLLEWDKADGYPLHFGKKDSIYTKINSLDEVLNDKKIKKLDLKKFNLTYEEYNKQNNIINISLSGE